MSAESKISHTAPEPTNHEHPNYVGIAIFLFVVTVLEVAIALVSLPLWIVSASLIILMLLKAVGVAGYYMHLRYESPIFSYLLVGGSCVATAVILAVAALYQNLPGQ